MTLRTALLLSLTIAFLPACSGLRGRSSALLPTAARPADVATADAFFASHPGRGMAPENAHLPTLSAAQSALVVELDQQRVYLYQGAELVAFSKLSSGRPNYRTETGTFVLGQKDRNHRSTVYGDFVDRQTGSIMMKDVMQGFDPQPVGGKFQGALMKNFQRLHTPSGQMTSMGFHTGILPGNPASHGCLRLPDSMAEWFYDHVPSGAVVTINGNRLGVPYGTVQKRAKREPKVHASLQAPPVPSPAEPMEPTAE